MKLLQVALDIDRLLWNHPTLILFIFFRFCQTPYIYTIRLVGPLAALHVAPGVTVCIMVGLNVPTDLLPIHLYRYKQITSV